MACKIKVLAQLQLRKEFIFRDIAGKENIPADLFYGLRAADGVLLQRIDYTVSGFRRVLFFYIKHLGATFRVRNRNFGI